MKISHKITDLFLCASAATLLILAYPRTELAFLAWFALVPMFFALDGKRPRAALFLGLFTGLLFFAGTLYWFFNIVRWFGILAASGIILLLAYLSLSFGLFGLAYSTFSKCKPLAKLVLLPAAWVVLEAARAYLFSGFDWVSLGHSQYKNLLVIQVADITGVFGVSFLVVMVNVIVKEGLSVYLGRGPFKAAGRRAGVNRLSLPLLVTALTVTLVLAYGDARLASTRRALLAAPRMFVAVIQPNIPQEMKWRPSAAPLMVSKHITLTEEAAQYAPDLIVWPESSCPDYLWDERAQFDRIRAFVRRIRIPLLIGSVVKEGRDYFNAAILLSADGDVVGTYRKVHLVPFGEFIPFRRFLPFLGDALGIGDFTPGRARTVMRVPQPQGSRVNKDRPGHQRRFSVLICFEDTVARLARGFVEEGARLLVNITNDAWFGDTKAAYLHLQSAAFRAVENRRGLVRAANTGMSCSVEATGRITGCIGCSRRHTYVRGFGFQEAFFTDQETFYTKFGDVFAILCFGCILMGIICIKKNKSIKT